MQDQPCPGTGSENTHRGMQIARYVAGARQRSFPEHVMAEACAALVDYMGVAIGSRDEPAARATRALANDWAMPGTARILCGGMTAPAMAALINGTMAHCQDYDDTHIGGGGHVAAPVLSTALACGQQAGADATLILKAFVTGYEVMARLGGGGIHGIGRAMQARGLHPTGINGAVGAAAAAAVIAEMDAGRTAMALSVAATSGAGLVASFGSDSKPYHAGRAAMSGILATDLARHGFQAADGLFELNGGMLDALIQDRDVQVPDLDFDGTWEILNNGYKPFACCRATHASIQAGQKLAPVIAGRAVRRVTAQVHYTAPFSAGKRNPQTPLECKFSVPFCLSAALCGYQLTAADFNTNTLRDPAVQAILPRVELIPEREQPQFEAYVTVWLQDGTHLQASTDCFLGHPDNPMSAGQVTAKFLSLVVPKLGQTVAERLLQVLRDPEAPGALAEIDTLVSA